jgi:hypothetical protein
MDLDPYESNMKHLSGLPFTVELILSCYIADAFYYRYLRLCCTAEEAALIFGVNSLTFLHPLFPVGYVIWVLG